MDFDLPIEVRLVQDLAASFARRDVAPVIVGYIARSQFPTPLIRRAAELGLLAIPYPVEYGGGGAGILANTVALEEIARVDPSVASILMTNNSPSSVLDLYGSEEQKRKWLAPLLAGEFLGCVGITEPGGGSDVVTLPPISPRS